MTSIHYSVEKPALETDRMAILAPHDSRSAWADVYKGAAIGLVVFGHVSGGVLAAQLIPSPMKEQVSTTRDWIYAFHMPAFFLISGAFAERSAHRGLSRFLSDKARTVLYPYFLWGVIFWCAHWMMSNLTNSQPDPWALKRMLITPPMGGSWFLYVIFFIFVLYGLWTQFGGGRKGFFTLAAVLFVAEQYGRLAFWDAMSLAGHYCIYFAAGILAGDAMRRLAEIGNTSVFAAITTAGFVVMSVLFLNGVAEQTWLNILPAFAGIAGLYGFSVLVTRTGPCEFLRFCGLCSLEIYVIHGFAAVLTRVVLVKACVRDPAIHLILGTTIGVLVPLLVAWLCRRAGFPYLFSLPRLPSNVAKTTNVGTGDMGN
jgi:fucose 4-O-acetylase-like acetyltransferase